VQTCICTTRISDVDNSFSKVSQFVLVLDRLPRRYTPQSRNFKASHFRHSLLANNASYNKQSILNSSVFLENNSKPKVPHEAVIRRKSDSPHRNAKRRSKRSEDPPFSLGKIRRHQHSHLDLYQIPWSKPHVQIPWTAGQSSKIRSPSRLTGDEQLPKRVPNE
jgi:hypothetical protein